MPIALKRLAIARIAVGIIFLLRTTPALNWFGVGWAERTLMGSGGSGWHPVPFGFALPSGVMTSLAVVRTVAALAFCIGLEGRWAGVVACALGYLALEQDPMGYVNSLHLLLSSTLLLALADSHSVFAIRARPARSPRTSVWLIRGLAMSVYAFSGIAKLNRDFLSGHALMNLHLDGELNGTVADFVCGSPSRAGGMSVLVAAFELGIPLLLVCRRTRTAALVLALAFHVIIEVSMHPDVFGWLMVILLFAFASSGRAASLATCGDQRSSH